jgi:hypothetical protein
MPNFNVCLALNTMAWSAMSNDRFEPYLAIRLFSQTEPRCVEANINHGPILPFA